MDSIVDSEADWNFYPKTTQYNSEQKVISPLKVFKNWHISSYDFTKC